MIGGKLLPCAQRLLPAWEGDMKGISAEILAAYGTQRKLVSEEEEGSLQR